MGAIDDGLSDESYTDTLNRLFPWGCETESEVVAELVRHVIVLEDDMEKLRGAVISDAVRLNTHAEDITQLAERFDTLEVEQAGNDRTFRELISDKAELAHRVEFLAKKIIPLLKRIEEGDEAALELARYIRGLTERIEKLEERED